MATIKVNQTIYKSTPSEVGRLSKEMKVYDVLQELGIQFEGVDHEIASTIDDCEEIEKLLDVSIYKNLFLCNKQETNFYLLIMPGKKSFKASIVSQQVQSSRLSFAPPHLMEKYLHTTPGSASILSLIYDRTNKVKLLVHKDLLQESHIACHPCINTSSLKIRTQDLLEKFVPYTGHDITIIELE